MSELQEIILIINTIALIFLVIDGYILSNYNAPGRVPRMKNPPPPPSLLYKPKEEQTTTVEVEQKEGYTTLSFFTDGGKFGTEEMLDQYNLTPGRLLQILQDHEDYFDHEC